MIRIAADRLKTEIDSLLIKAEAGDEIIIERDGKPVARLVADNIPTPALDPDAVVAEWQQMRAGMRLDGLSLKTLRDEGRR